MDFHPLSTIFPLLEGEHFKELCDDIEAHGQRVPILTYEGKVLDGRNRYRACEALNIEPHYEEFTGDNPLQTVISLNLIRRHLTDSQRAMVAARLANHPGSNAPGVPKGDASGHVTRAAAARLLNVSPSHVRSARKVLKGDAETIEKVDSGEMKIGQAIAQTVNLEVEFPTKAIINAFGAAVMRHKVTIRKAPKEQRIKIVKRLAACLNVTHEIDLNADISGDEILRMIDFLQMSESRLVSIPANVRFDMARQFCECLGVVPRKIGQSLTGSALA